MVLCAINGCACAHPSIPFGHYGVTLHNVTSGQKAPLGWPLRNCRLHMRTPKGTPKGSRDRRSLPVAMVLVVLYYCYSKKKSAGMHFRAHAKHNSGHFRSGPTPDTWLLVTFLPVAPPRTTSSNIVWAVSIYYWSHFDHLCTSTGVKLMIVTIVTTIPRWRTEKPVKLILIIISLCVVYLRTVCW